MSVTKTVHGALEGQIELWHWHAINCYTWQKQIEAPGGTGAKCQSSLVIVDMTRTSMEVMHKNVVSTPGPKNGDFRAIHLRYDLRS